MAGTRIADDLDDGTEVDAAPFVDTEEMPYATLMKMLAGDDDQGDDVAFGKGSDTPPAKDAEPVSIEEGIDLIDSANAKGRKDAKVQAPPEDKAAEPAAPPASPPPAKEEPAPAAEPAPAETFDMDAMLDGLPDDRKDAIRGRLTAANEMADVFKGYESRLQQFGAKPVDAVKRLVDLYAYAERNPTEYLAWAATQTGNAQQALSAAAERLGFKLVADTTAQDDDDPFEDPSVKAMRQELAQYKARDRQAQVSAIGPDAPMARAQVELTQLAASLPHWQQVAPQIAAMASYQANLGRPTTLDDVRRFYQAALVASGIADAPGPQSDPQPVSAAQPAPVVAQQTAAKTAADAERLERSKKASMSLDGSGQGAGRRPALDPDASIHSVLSTLMQEQSRRG